MKRTHFLAMLVFVASNVLTAVVADAPDVEGKTTAVETADSSSTSDDQLRSQESDGAAVGSAEVGDPVSNRCSDLDMSVFSPGQICGSPLSLPCFDYCRCKSPAQGGNGPTIYVYDLECTLADSERLSLNGELDGERLSEHQVGWFWRNVVKEAGLLAETYESACLFLHVNRDPHDPCATRAPLWNGGVNHVMVDFSDSTRDTRPIVAGSFAMEAASNMHTCYYRSGYDMSLPLELDHTFHDLVDTGPLEREFFLTVKGSVYLSSHGSEERMSVVPLHDEANGVIAAMHCYEYHKEHLLPENVNYCERLKARFDDHDYESLMNTTFGLVPAGRSVGTYRLGEVMSAGAIPVFVARDIVRPFREQVNWPSFSFVFAPDRVGPDMMKTLRAVSPEALREMQRKSLDAYWEVFGGKTKDFDPIARKTVNILQQRVGHHR